MLAKRIPEPMTAADRRRARAIFLVALVTSALAASTATAQPAADPRPEVPAAAMAPSASTPLPVRTRLAYFAPTQFGDLPGWREDDFRESARAFRETCNALGRRPTWTVPCAKFAAIDSRRGDEFRRFLEAEFALYQIHNHDESPIGVITGYYEPLLTGSRQQDSRYAHPVYGVPDDLLFLDARDASAATAATTLSVRGRNVVVNEPGKSASGEPSYTLQIGSISPDRRDRKVRVRIDGTRIVPYHSRAQIEAQGLPQATVIVWVEDPAALYSMHVQGSGKIRLPDGEILRLAFAEQNGHPFLPPVSAGRMAASAPIGLRTRGIDLQAAIEAQEPLPSEGVLTRGIAAGGDKPAPARVANDTAAVEAMVELLLGGGAAAPKAAPAKAAPAKTAAADEPRKTPPVVAAPVLPPPEIKPPIASRPPSETTPPPVAAESKSAATFRPPPAPIPPVVAQETKLAAASRPPPDAASPPAVATTSNAPAIRPQFNGDPSYIFFRQIRDYEGGPIGALGVPLTAQRSIAVDPRTTPLGMPVYIASDGAGGGGIRRLMVAQDTGGAIRGAVRADFFWGFGPQAGQRASQTRLLGRMWVLMPKSLVLAALPGAITTRSVGRGIIDLDAECVIADADLCVE